MPDPVTGVVAGTGVLGAGMANNASKRATKAAEQSEAAALGFAKEQYQDWLDIFGPIQDNLSSYYQNLTPARIEAQGRQAIELERDQWLTRIDEDFAARGLSDSALAGSVVAGVERDTAMAKAGVSANAERMAAQEKLNFLTIGYGQNPAGNLQNTLNSQASGARSRASDAQYAAGQAIGSAINTTGTALTDYFRGGKK